MKTETPLCERDYTLSLLLAYRRPTWNRQSVTKGVGSNSNLVAQLRPCCVKAAIKNTSVYPIYISSLDNLVRLFIFIFNKELVYLKRAAIAGHNLEPFGTCEIFSDTNGYV
jgi:hypothetical protein